MSVERFDRVARLLAQGASRRQILKGFAAGLGASLFSVFGFTQDGRYHPAAQAAPLGDGSFLPLIKGAGDPICSVASTCNNVVNCGRDDENCRCIESAEGEIRCGQVPSCSAQRCTLSADCAGLGEGYFCDSVGSGCCDDEQRCIAPCQGSGPEVEPVEGTWTGTLSYEEQVIGIQFVLSEEDGAIQGRLLMQDPVSNEFLETGPLTGDYAANGSVLYLESGSFATGNFQGESFTGEFTFTSFNGEPPVTVPMNTQRS